MKFLLLIGLCASWLFGAVDINTADVDELSTLNGVSSKKAAAIIEYRDAHCFENISDIVNVKGIGSKFLEKNREFLTASTCK